MKRVRADLGKNLVFEGENADTCIRFHRITEVEELIDTVTKIEPRKESEAVSDKGKAVEE